MLTPERPALLKLGEAGGPPRNFAEAAKSRGVRAAGASAALLDPGVCGARPGARGRPAEPTPSHSRALGRAPCFGLPTKAGGSALDRAQK